MSRTSKKISVENPIDPGRRPTRVHAKSEEIKAAKKKLIGIITYNLHTEKLKIEEEIKENDAKLCSSLYVKKLQRSLNVSKNLPLNPLENEIEDVFAQGDAAKEDHNKAWVQFNQVRWFNMAPQCLEIGQREVLVYPARIETNNKSLGRTKNGKQRKLMKEESRLVTAGEAIQNVGRESKWQGEDGNVRSKARSGGAPKQNYLEVEYGVTTRRYIDSGLRRHTSQEDRLYLTPVFFKREKTYGDSDESDENFALLLPEVTSEMIQPEEEPLRPRKEKRIEEKKERKPQEFDATEELIKQLNECTLCTHCPGVAKEMEEKRRLGKSSVPEQSVGKEEKLLAPPLSVVAPEEKFQGRLRSSSKDVEEEIEEKVITVHDLMPEQYGENLNALPSFALREVKTKRKKKKNRLKFCICIKGTAEEIEETRETRKSLMPDEQSGVDVKKDVEKKEIDSVAGKEETIEGVEQGGRERDSGSKDIVREIEEMLKGIAKVEMKKRMQESSTDSSTEGCDCMDLQGMSEASEERDEEGPIGEPSAFDVHCSLMMNLHLQQNDVKILMELF